MISIKQIITETLNEVEINEKLLLKHFYIKKYKATNGKTIFSIAPKDYKGQQLIAKYGLDKLTDKLSNRKQSESLTEFMTSHDPDALKVVTDQGKTVYINKNNWKKYKAKGYTIPGGREADEPPDEKIDKIVAKKEKVKSSKTKDMTVKEFSNWLSDMKWKISKEQIKNITETIQRLPKIPNKQLGYFNKETAKLLPKEVIMMLQSNKIDEDDKETQLFYFGKAFHLQLNRKSYDKFMLFTNELWDYYNSLSEASRDEEIIKEWWLDGEIPHYNSLINSAVVKLFKLKPPYYYRRPNNNEPSEIMSKMFPDKYTNFEKNIKSLYREGQKILKKRVGDKLQLYRGTKGKFTTLNSVESWTIDKRIAKEFGRNIIEKTVPTKNILFPFALFEDYSGQGVSNEMEFTVMNSEET